MGIKCWFEERCQKGIESCLVLKIHGTRIGKCKYIKDNNANFIDNADCTIYDGNWIIDLIKDDISVCQQMEMVAVNQAV